MDKKEFDKKHSAKPFGSEYIPIHDRPSWDLGMTILPQRYDTCANKTSDNDGFPFCAGFGCEKAKVPDKYILYIQIRDTKPEPCP
jgi:hypothetical protein